MVNTLNPALTAESLRALVAEGLTSRQIAARAVASYRYTCKRLREEGLTARRDPRPRLTHCYRDHDTTDPNSRTGSTCKRCIPFYRKNQRHRDRAGEDSKRSPLTEMQSTELILDLGGERETAPAWRRQEIDVRLAGIEIARRSARAGSGDRTLKGSTRMRHLRSDGNA